VVTFFPPLSPRHGSSGFSMVAARTAPHARVPPLPSPCRVCLASWWDTIFSFLSRPPRLSAIRRSPRHQVSAVMFSFPSPPRRYSLTSPCPRLRKTHPPFLFLLFTSLPFPAAQAGGAVPYLPLPKQPKNSMHLLESTVQHPLSSPAKLYKRQLLHFYDFPSICSHAVSSGRALKMFLVGFLSVL